MEFLQQFNESSQYRTKDKIKQTDLRTIADNAFMDMLALIICYFEFDTSSSAVSYAKKTSQSLNFKLYKNYGTDLYLLLHTVATKDPNLIAGDPNSQTLLTRIGLNQPRTISFLQAIAGTRLTASLMRQFLQQFERELGITNGVYKSLRRMVQEWPMLNQSQKSIAATRLMQFYRTKAPRSDMFIMLQRAAKSQNLEITDTTDKESNAGRTLAQVAGAIAIGGAAAYTGYTVGNNIARKLI